MKSTDGNPCCSAPGGKVKRRDFLYALAAAEAPLPLQGASPNITSLTRNVLAYGAKADGKTNDAPSIQAALDDVPPGGCVLLPSTANFYRCDHELKISKPGITLIGQSAGGNGPRFLGGSHLRFSPKVERCISLAHPEEQLYGNRLRDLKLTVENPKGIAIYVDRAVEVELSSLDIWHTASKANLATGIYLDATKGGSTREHWTGLIRILNIRMSWFYFGVRANNDRWVTAVSIIASAISGLSPTAKGSIGLENLGNGSFVGAGTDIEGWETGIKTGSGGTLCVVGARFEANSKTDVEVQESAVDIHVSSNSHSTICERVVEIPVRARARSYIQAVAGNHPRRSLVSKGHGHADHETHANGQFLRHSYYLRAHSENPMFSLSIGMLEPRTELGDTTTRASCLLSAHSWPLKIGTSSGIELYAAGAKRAELDGRSGAFVMRTALAQSQGKDVEVRPRLILNSDGNYFRVKGSDTIRAIDPTNWQGGATVVLRFLAPCVISHSKGSSVPVAPIALREGSDFKANEGSTLTLIYDEAERLWLEINRCSYSMPRL
jgi:hypothetical protein